MDRRREDNSERKTEEDPGKEVEGERTTMIRRPRKTQGKR